MRCLCSNCGQRLLACEGHVTRLLLYCDCLQGTLLYFFTGSLHFLFYSVEWKERPAQKLSIEEISILSTSTFNRNRYLKYIWAECHSNYCLWYRPYVILKDVQLKDAKALVHGISLERVADDKSDKEGDHRDHSNMASRSKDPGRYEDQHHGQASVFPDEDYMNIAISIPFKSLIGPTFANHRQYHCRFL